MANLYKQWTPRGLMSLLAMLMMALTVSAQIPSVTKFHPAAADPAPELKSNAKVYVYFNTGAHVSSLTYQIEQNGSVLGSSTVAGAYNSYFGTWGNTITINLWAEDFAKNIQTGTFDLVVKSFNYILDDAEQTCSFEADAPKVTYMFKGKPATIIAVEPLTDSTLLSYYPADSSEGVMSITFDKPMMDGYTVQLEYGDPGKSNNHALMTVPSTLNGSTITLDFRGALRSVHSMVPNAHFTDDNGNDTDPPATIGLTLSGLKSTDGEVAMPVTVDPSGHEHVLAGLVNYVLHYQDISFATPIITSVMFCNSANTAEQTANIGANTDMMVINLLNANNLVSASVKLDIPGASFTVSDYTNMGGQFLVPLPAKVIEAGSANLTISIVNTVYTVDDGEEHVIKPYCFGDVPVSEDLTTIAEVKALAPGSDVTLKADGIYVTMANDMGYMFIEDTTGALQVVTADYSVPLTQGMVISGTIVGQYEADGMLTIDTDLSSIVQSEPAQPLEPALLTLAQAQDPANHNRLVCFSADNGSTLQYSYGQPIMIDGQLPAIIDLIDDIDQIPDNISSVSGILYNMPDGVSSKLIVIVRDLDDIVAQSAPVVTEVASIAELLTLEPKGEFVINASDITVTFFSEDYCMGYVEDASGAAMIYCYAELSQGDVLNGRVVCSDYSDNSFTIDSFEEADITTTDVSTGRSITVAEAFDPANAFRLVTLTKSADVDIVVDGFGAMINDVLPVVDYFDILPWTYEFPEDIQSVTGILLLVEPVQIDADDNNGLQAMLTIRGEDDIVAGNHDSIDTVVGDDGTATTDIYTVSGVRVLRAGGNTDSLLPGIYVGAGRKVIVK